MTESLVWAITAAVFAAIWLGIIFFGWREECVIRVLCRMPAVSFWEYLRREELR